MTRHDPERELDSPYSWRRWLRLNLALLALVGLLCASMPVSSLDQRLSDWLFRLRGNRATSGKVALVLIDDDSLARHGRWPWHRRELARLLRVTSSFHPKAVGIDILLAEHEDESNDAELAQAIAATPNAVLTSKISGSTAGGLWVEPLPIFARGAAAVGHAQAAIDADGVCRTVPITEPGVDGPRFAFALKLAEIADPQLAALEKSALEEQDGPGYEAKRMVTQHLRINYAPQLGERDRTPSYGAIPAGDLLDGKSGELLSGKVVLLGFGGTEISDRLFTPVSGQIPMPGVEVNANVVDMLLSGQQLREPGWIVRALLAAALSMCMLWIVLRWPGARGLVFLLSALAAAYATGLFLFARFHVLLHFGPVVVAAVLAAPLAQLENLLAVDRAVNRRLRDLQEILAPSGPDAARRRLFLPGSDDGLRLHWKLRALRSLQARLGSLYLFDQMLLDTMQEGLAVFRGDGGLVFHNPGWRRFCQGQGLAPESSLRDVTDLMGGWPELDHIARESGVWLDKEVGLGQGQWRIRAAALPQSAHAESGATMLLAEDTTPRRERDRARGEALSFVTHELRTPLIAIQGFAQFMMRYPERSTTSEAPATIFREARRLVAMINAYLEVLRLDVGARPLRRKPVDILAVANHVEQIVQPLAQSARIRIRVEKARPELVLACDETLMSGALLNLLSNAVKYSPAGSEVVLSIFADAEAMEFSVHNFGPVIPAAELNRLFEPFYRVAEQGETRPGWGLGLAFVKRIAEQHGGRVEVASDATTGTCFRIVLPITCALEGEAGV